MTGSLPSVGILIAAAVGLAGAALVLVGLAGDRARGRARCPFCWYTVTGASGLRCPSCGEVVWTAQDYFQTRRHWGAACLGIVLVLVSAIAAAWLMTLGG